MPSFQEPPEEPQPIVALRVRHPDLEGRTLGDFVAYFHVRLGFLESLSQDESVSKLWPTWAAHDGLSTKAANLAGRANQLARVVGLTDRVQLLKATRVGLKVDPEVMSRPAIQTAFDLISNASDEFGKALDAFLESDWLLEQIQAYLAERDLSWRWLENVFIDAFLGNLNAFITGTEYVSGLALTHKLLPAPPNTRLVFEPNPGESATAARLRLRNAAKVLDQQLARAARAGSVPMKRCDTYHQYGHWLYRSAIRGDSHRLIARTEVGENDRRSQVKYGLNRAREFLQLGDLITEERLRATLPGAKSTSSSFFPG